MPTNPDASSIILTKRDHERLSALASASKGRYAEISLVLGDELERALLVESAKVPPNVVTMNSCVALRDESSGQARNFTLVYPRDENISIGNLSILTPAGVALIGLVENDVLAWATRDGQMKEMTLLEVLYQPEAEGRFDL